MNMPIDNTAFSQTCRSNGAHERGAVLYVALVFLILFTLLALVASRTSLMQERMTGGMRNAELGLMGAESAVRGVESGIWNAAAATGTSSKLNCGFNGLDNNCYTAQSFTGTDANGNTVTVYKMSDKVQAFRTQPGWLAESGDGAAKYATADLTATGSTPAGARLAKQPRYLIEYLGRVLPSGSPNNPNGGAIDNAGSQAAGSNNLRMYRITARSTGGNDGTLRTVESVFTALPPNN